MSAFDSALLSLDTETTGRGNTDRVVEIGVALVEPDGTVSASSSTIINAGVEVPEVVVAIHGITTERCQTEGIDPVRAFTDLFELLASHDGSVVIYNASFDLRFLRNEALRHKVPMPDLHVIDPLLIARASDPPKHRRHRLVDEMEHFGIEWTGAAHGAEADCIASAQVLLAHAAANPRLRTRPIGARERGVTAEAIERHNASQPTTAPAFDPFAA